jgi:CubicO group peptidase (beta-lactamase class C family)
MRHARIIVTHYGGPDALRVVEEECPELKDGEVRVRVLAAGVSLPDLLASARWFTARGLGLSIVTRRDDVAGVPGRFGWDGAFSTSLYVDPREDMVGVLVAQCRPGGLRLPPIVLDFWTSAAPGPLSRRVVSPSTVPLEHDPGVEPRIIPLSLGHDDEPRREGPRQRRGCPVFRQLDG